MIINKKAQKIELNKLIHFKPEYRNLSEEEVIDIKDIIYKQIFFYLLNKCNKIRKIELNKRDNPFEAKDKNHTPEEYCKTFDKPIIFEEAIKIIKENKGDEEMLLIKFIGENFIIERYAAHGFNPFIVSREINLGKLYDLKNDMIFYYGNDDLVDVFRKTQWNTSNKSGSLKKRIDKAIFKGNIQILGEKFKTNNNQELGQYISKISTPNKIYHIDFTDKFNWDSGDFGDEGSCFWASRTSNREMMERDPRFLAMRFFTEKLVGFPDLGKTFYKEEGKEGYSGKARSWLWKARIKKEIKKNSTIISEVYVIFNGYGYQTDLIANIFANIHNQEVKKIRVLYDGDTTDKLWINNGAYAVSTKEILSDLEVLDLVHN